MDEEFLKCQQKFNKLLNQNAAANQQYKLFFANNKWRRQTQNFIPCPSLFPQIPSPNYCQASSLLSQDDDESFMESVMPFIRCLNGLRKMELRVSLMNDIFAKMQEKKEIRPSLNTQPYRPSKPICMQEEEEAFYWGLIPHLKLLSPEARLRIRSKFFENLHRVYEESGQEAIQQNNEGFVVQNQQQQQQFSTTISEKTNISVLQSHQQQFNDFNLNSVSNIPRRKDSVVQTDLVGEGFNNFLKTSSSKHYNSDAGDDEEDVDEGVYKAYLNAHLNNFGGGENYPRSSRLQNNDEENENVESKNAKRNASPKRRSNFFNQF